MSRYIFKIARNLAIDLLERFEDDAMTGAVVFSCLPEWEREDEDEQPGEDRPGTPEVVELTIEDRILAHQLWDRARKRDLEAAEWLVRHKVDEETVPEIAADVSQPAGRIYKRVSRLIERLQPQRDRREAARACRAAGRGWVTSVPWMISATSSAGTASRSS